MIESAISSGKTWLSESLIKALNFHAIVGLHPQAGMYRPTEVTVGTHIPPDFWRVEALMEDFVNYINRNWHDAVPSLAAYALWRINNIHPFINGNGRTARAVCYYILCVKTGGLLPGSTIVPEILRNDPMRTPYYHALRYADGSGDIGPLSRVVVAALARQVGQPQPQA
ncbi:MAG: Fic family protein [Chloroflexi bacterium]|nr:Fic family protein [Chloroflexota bacterium]MYE39514.1 Fic family protein [Chloroflexota bacterium]